MKAAEIVEIALALLLKEGGGQLPVLIVDDEKPLADYIAIRLRDEGIACEVQTTIVGAREYLKANKVGLILLDVKFKTGEKDGLSFLAELEINEAVHKVPIVLLTGATLWISTVDGPKEFRKSNPKELSTGRLWMMIFKGSMPPDSAVMRAVKIMGMSGREAKKVAVYQLLKMSGAVVFGAGLHAGWWVQLLVEIKKLF